MSWESLFGAYGYAALLLGTILGGGWVLVLAGVAVQLGHLRLPWVFAICSVGGTIGYLGWFLLGRFGGRRLLARYPSLQGRLARVQRLFDRYSDLLLLTARFIYGIRALTPLALGMGRMTAPRFLVLNAVGAGLWASVFIGAGYVAGQAIDPFLGRLRQYQLPALLIALGGGILVWLIARVWGRLRQRSPIARRLR